MTIRHAVRSLPACRAPRRSLLRLAPLFVVATGMLAVPASASADISVAKASLALLSAAERGEPPGPGETCYNVEFIGARGSGESYAETPYGMGGTIAALYAKVLPYLPSGQTMSAVGLPYKAVVFYSPEYSTSVREGIRELKEIIDNKAKECPSTKFMIGGFSQGADVVGETMSYMAEEGDGAVYSIKGIVLYADPRFNPNDPTVDRGDFNHCCGGILEVRPPFTSAEGLNQHIESWCRNADPVCQSYGSNTNHAYVNYKNGQFIEEGAEFMAYKMRWISSCSRCL